MIPTLSIPVNLNITGLPEIAFSDSILNFGSIMQNTDTTINFAIENTGCDTLQISLMTIADASFQLSGTAYTIAQGSSQQFSITFAPQAGGVFADTLFIENNHTDTFICLAANSLGAPAIAINPDTINVNLNCADSVIVPLTISNNGTGDLEYQILGNSFGTGSDGTLSVNSGSTYYADAIKSKADGNNLAGQNTVSVSDATGFSQGDEILIISMQDPETNLSLNITGQYETQNIVSISGNTLTLNKNLEFDYNQSGGKKHQIIRIPQFTDVTVDGTITCDNWNGETGGIVFFRATNTVTVNGSIDVSGKGYRGGNGSASGNYKFAYSGEGTSGGLVFKGDRTAGGSAQG